MEAGWGLRGRQRKSRWLGLCTPRWRQILFGTAWRGSPLWKDLWRFACCGPHRLPVPESCNNRPRAGAAPRGKECAHIKSEENSSRAYACSSGKRVRACTLLKKNLKILMLNLTKSNFYFVQVSVNVCSSWNDMEQRLFLIDILAVCLSRAKTISFKNNSQF